MFSRLGEPGYRRTPLEAVGFYLVYAVLFVVLAALAGAAVGLLDPPAAESGMSELVGNVVAVLCCLALAVSLLRVKGLIAHPVFLTIGALGPLLAVFGGALLGLIPLAFLTTRAPRTA